MELVEFITHYPGKENTLQLAKRAVKDEKHRRQLWELTKSKISVFSAFQVSST